MRLLRWFSNDKNSDNDDDSTIRQSLRDTLEVERYEVIEAPNGEVGITMALHHLPDLIISDVSMPHMDGFSGT